MHTCICPVIGPATNPKCLIDNGKAAKEVRLPHDEGCHCYITKIATTVLRATTYQIVAHGKCKLCKTKDVDLRFVYNPYGDDILCCMECADRSDTIYGDDGK